MSTKKVIRKRRVITRGNVRWPEDTYETIEALEARLTTEGQPHLPKIPGATVRLKRKHIKVAELAFQWRTLKSNRIPNEDAVLDFARAIERGDEMAPILVFPVGQNFYVIDGHHRLAAYDIAKKNEAIPAQVFAGTLREAERAALRANNKPKLPLTREDRTNAAWRIVRQNDPRDSIASTMEDADVSKGTVNTMRAARRTLCERGTPDDEIQKMTWWNAKTAAKEGEDETTERAGDEGWMETAADQLVDALMHAKLAGHLTRNPEITARVLAKLDAGLPDALRALWEPEPESVFDPHEGTDEDAVF